MERHSGNTNQLKITESTGKGVIRASAISTYSRCPFTFFSKFLHNLPTAIQRAQEQINKDITEATVIRTRYSAAAALGTSVHSGMEVGIKAKMKGLDTPIELMIQSAQEEFETLNKEKDLWYNIDKGENFQSFKEQLPELVTAYAEDILPFVDNPTATENVYTVEVSNPLFHSIQGSIDVEQIDAVRDLKVTGRKTRIDRHLAQLSVYAWIREQANKPTSKVYIDNIVKNKTKISTYILEDKPKTKYVDNTLKQLLFVTEEWYNAGCVGAGSDLLDLIENPKREQDLRHLMMIFAGSNPSDDFLCNDEWCDTYAVCPFVKGWKDIKIIGETIEI